MKIIKIKDRDPEAFAIDEIEQGKLTGLAGPFSEACLREKLAELGTADTEITRLIEAARQNPIP